MHSFRCHDLLLDYKEANVTLICKSWTCEIVHGISLGIWKAHRKIRKKKKEREKREKERKKKTKPLSEMMGKYYRRFCTSIRRVKTSSLN